MARRRLTPAQPGYLAPAPAPATASAPETKSMAGPAARPPIAQVAGQSAEAAALRDLARGIETARNEGRLIVEVPLAEIAPDHLIRDRVAFDPEELGALKASIAAHGQRSPAEVTPLAGKQAARGEGAADATAPRYGLISGWRRFRALSELHAETGEARFAQLRALLRSPGAAAESYIAMVEENEIRVGLSYYERARVVAEAARAGIFPDQSAALRQLFASASRAKRSKIASFIDIHEALGDVLGFPAEIPERLGLALVARLRHGDRTRLRRALAEARPARAAEELALLERLARPPQAQPRGDVSRAKQVAEELRPGLALAGRCRGGRVTLTLSGEGADEALLEEACRLLRGLGGA